MSTSKDVTRRGDDVPALRRPDLDGVAGSARPGRPMMNNPNRSNRPVRAAIQALASFAFLIGAGLAILGPAGLPGVQGNPEGSFAQEFRFSPVWWVGLGAYLWWLARRTRTAHLEVRIVLGTLFAVGLLSWLSFVAHGWPHPMFVAMAAIEVLAPLPLVWWQSQSECAD